MAVIVIVLASRRLPTHPAMWAYDQQADYWTERIEPPTEITSLTYDPITGQVVAWSYGEPWSYDVEWRFDVGSGA